MEHVNRVFGNCLIENERKSSKGWSKTQQEYNLNSVCFIKDFHWSSKQNKVAQNKVSDIVIDFNTKVRVLFNWEIREEVGVESSTKNWEPVCPYLLFVSRSPQNNHYRA